MEKLPRQTASTTPSQKGNWKKTRISEFLFAREGKYKPDSDKIIGLKRIDKIDFSGNFHIVEKPSKTDMILIQPNDFVISGINVAKGAMGIYRGKEDVSATIHYSSYTFDESKIDSEYFKRFLKSTEFIRLLQEQVKGGIKTEIKPKHVLPLEIIMPNIIEQKKIAEYFKSIETENSDLKAEITHQQTLLKKLRQQILQEAIEGKLTADWRQENQLSHFQGGVPRSVEGVKKLTPLSREEFEPASELLKRIQAEKEQLIKDKKIKLQKPLPPITEAEKAFTLPDGWAWCQLGNISNYGQKLNVQPDDIKNNTWVLDLEDIEKTTSQLLHKVRHGNRKSTSTKSIFKKGSILYGKLRPYLDKVIIADEDGVCTTEIMPIQLFGDLNPAFVRFLLKSQGFIKFVNSKVSGMRMPRLNTESAREAVLPLPSLPEQQAIVVKAEKLFALCDELEIQVTQNQNHAKALMQSVLKEAFMQPMNDSNESLQKLLANA